MRISGVSSTDLFAGTAGRPLQIITVTLAGDSPGPGGGPGGPVTVRIAGAGVSTPEPALTPAPGPGSEVTAEVGVLVAAPAAAGSRPPVTVIAEGDGGRAETAAEITVAETGWTMWMVSHFHYDPVWWNTQGEFLQTRLLLPGSDGELPDVRTAFELIRLHLDAARADPDYKFVLAEIDYLKPHFDAHPEDRADLLRFIAAGRIELVGGSYNEPNTNLTCAESTIRNAVYGLAFQRGVLRGSPSSAWMLDAFGFDPGYPGLMAAAGLAESAWARGPFHQWGPGRTAGDNRLMQFASEFEWIAPDGSGLLTSYMANHYSAGWATQQAADLASAQQAAYQQFRELAPVAATRNVLLPVGGDHVIPSRWATAIHRGWNSRYVWPKFVTAVPREFFAAVRADAAARDIWITPQTRDMNPVYTGKDVSFIDTKQGQRAAEIAVCDGERLATLAWLAGAEYPAASLDKAWHQLVFGAHHDAITGTEGDQVYLDLLAGWREAWERGEAARRAAIGYLAARAGTAAAASAAGPAGDASGPGPAAIVVVNSLAQPRSGMARVTLGPAGAAAPAGWLALRDDAGAAVPFLAEGVTRAGDGALREVTLTFRARDVPALGYRTYLAVPVPGPPGGPQEAASRWQPVPGTAIENAAFAVTADPQAGGTLSRITDRRTGAELLAGPANELLLQEEYPAHPRWGEGPWLLSTTGAGRGSAGAPARLRAERCPAGSRLVAEFTLGGLTVTQETLLWDGASRIEFRTHADGSIGQDRLLRVAFPVAVAGGLPVYQSALSVLGRPFGAADTDVARHSFTLDNPAHEWFGLGSTARVAVAGPDGARQLQAIGVAEVVASPAPARAAAPGAEGAAGAGADGAAPSRAVPSRAVVRELMAALARQGVTATCSVPGGPRYGSIDVDSNLPDFRILLGGPDVNEVSAALLATAGAAAAELARQVAAAGRGRVWVPAARGRQQAFAPGADVRGARDLPALIVAAADLEAAAAELLDDLADAVIEVPGPAPDPADTGAGGPQTALAGHCVALLNRGTPSSLVTPDGVLTIALMRACSAWPCGVWIDGEPRTTPDGSSFAWQHWSHTFEYALAAGPGDWRTAGFPQAGLEYNHDLLTVVTGLHDGDWPATASLASVEPATAVLTALKPRGNPLAPGSQPARGDGVTVRLRDVSGGAGTSSARVRLFTGVRSAASSSLCEDAAGAALPLADGAAVAGLPAAGVATLTLLPAQDTPAGPAGLPGGGPGPAEPAQPVFARYWLHGKGPAPAGNMPVAVHLSPARLDVGGAPDGGQAGLLRLTVGAGAGPAAGSVRLGIPAGLAVEPAGPLDFDLPALGHACWDLAVRARPGAGGRAFVTAQITDHLGQLTEDAVLTVTGEAAPPAPGAPLAEHAAWYEADRRAQAAEAELRVAEPELALCPGEAGQLTMLLRNGTAAVIRGEAQLISPFGSWARAGPPAAGFCAGPGELAEIGFQVAAPATARPGEHWWALVKVMYFGRVRYTEAVPVTVRG